MNIKKLLGVWILLLLVGCGGEKGSESTEENKGTAEKESKKEVEKVAPVEPPLPGIGPPSQEFKVSAEKDTVLIYKKTGSFIEIPAHAFLNGKGKMVKGKVDLSYRELHSPLEFYAAGVPMEYDSADQDFVFESGGMCEIRAEKNGKSLQANPENKIKVNMNSPITRRGMGLYDLNEETNQWERRGKPERRPGLEIPPPPKFAGVPIERVDAGRVQILTKKKLFYEPDFYETGLASSFITVMVDKDHNGIPFEEELKQAQQYQNLFLKPLNEDKCDVVPLAAGLEVTETSRAGVVKVVTYEDDKKEKSRTCLCKKVYEDLEEYNAARKEFFDAYMKKFNESYPEYLEKREDHYEYWQKLRQRVRNYEMSIEKYRKQYGEEVFNNLRPVERIEQAFRVKNFGFINCDTPSRIPDGAELLASFQNGKGKSLELKELSLAEMNTNSLYRYSPDKVKFDPGKKNLLWGLTQDDKLAYMKPERFGKIEKTSGDHTFNMKVHEEKLDSFEELQSVIFE